MTRTEVVKGPRPRPPHHAACRLGLAGAIATLAGAVLSGPVAMAIVAASHPQPAWDGAARFALAFHPVQTLPFFFGFVLVSGFVMLVAALHAVAGARRAVTAVAMVLTAVFAALVFLNYVLQTTLVPALVAHQTDADAPLVAALTMANPTSLAWGLEMWGYGLLGVATWLVAPAFAGSRLERAAAWAFAINGPISVAGALWTALRPGWVMTAPGLAAFAAWNVLVVAMAALALAVFRARLHRPAPLAASRPTTANPLPAGAAP